MKFKPIKWDGRERTAERLADVMPSMTISWWGGAPGHPREVFICDRKARVIQKVKRGQLVGKDAKGRPKIVRTR
jgi:hypothetical protein